MSVVHIVVARANVSNKSGTFTNNLFVQLKGTPKRMRGNTKIANVETFTGNITVAGSPFSKANVCGLALYDIGTNSKTSQKCESILIKGVADVILSNDDLQEVKKYKFCRVLQEKEQIDKDNRKYRCFFNFLEKADTGPTATLEPGLESTETHLAITHNFKNITDPTKYDVGNFTYLDPSVFPNNNFGIMLWPLTKKATFASAKEKYTKAAVLTQGVVTSFCNDTSKLEPLKTVTFLVNGKSKNVLVLEVYERSFKFMF